MMRLLKKIANYFLPVCFAMLLTLPFLNDRLEIFEFKRKNENRVFRDSLNINLKKLDNFPKEANQYVNDNFSFRSPLLDVFHNLKVKGFKISPHLDKTILGKDGWCFMTRKELEIFQGKHLYSLAELNAFKTEWHSRKQFLDSLGIKSYWMVAPLKHYVYPEKLPLGIKEHETRRVEQLKRHLNTSFPNLVIDLLPVLKEAKGATEQLLYYKLDHHWTAFAGMKVVEKLASVLKADFPNKTVPNSPQVNWVQEIKFEGFHYDVLGLDSLAERTIIPELIASKAKKAKLYGFKSPEGFAFHWAYEKRYQVKELENGIRVLIIRDSFGKNVLPFAKELFKESLFIFDAWKYGLNEEIILETKPDAVIFLTLEAYIDNLIE